MCVCVCVYKLPDVNFGTLSLSFIKQFPQRTSCKNAEIHLRNNELLPVLQPICLSLNLFDLYI